MTVQELELSTAREQATALPFALLHTLSRVSLGPTPENIDWEELTEARFFGPEREIRFAGSRAWLQTPGGIELKEEQVSLRPGFGKTLTLRRSCRQDEDGQLVPGGIRLTGWKGAEQRG